jgi:Trk K+ transport system NAD-binding subunit
LQGEVVMLFLFILTLIISFIAVRIGAIAFQLTGLEWSLAKFQALSCFTGTGFTTKESELITSSKQRRKIASILMVLGNAGLVIMISTLANSLVPQETVFSKLSRSIIPLNIQQYLVKWVNLGVIVLLVYMIYIVFTREKISMIMTNFLRRRIIKKELFKSVSFEELLLATGGYGVSKIIVCAGSPALDKSLSESQLRRHDITVLAITRDGHTIPNPSADTKILLNDELICFGKLESIRRSILCQSVAVARQ